MQVWRIVPVLPAFQAEQMIPARAEQTNAKNAAQLILNCAAFSNSFRSNLEIHARDGVALVGDALERLGGFGAGDGVVGAEVAAVGLQPAADPAIDHVA